VKLRYSNFNIKQKHALHRCRHKLQRVVKDLYCRRMLVRLIGVRFSNLIPGNDQINTFEHTERMIHLYQAIDSIKHQYGENLLIRASGF
jgi:DNA polymerase IV